MRIEVKLYFYHDIDLVSLYKTGRIAFPATTKQVLNAYARKEIYKVKLLDVNQKRASKYPQEGYRKFFHYHIELDEEEDADAIELLQRITPGYRNNFIKAVLRQYICGEFSPEYLIDRDAEYLNERAKLFQSSKEEKEIRQKRRKKKTKERQKEERKKQGQKKEKGNEKEKKLTKPAGISTFEGPDKLASPESQNLQSKHNTKSSETFVPEPATEFPDDPFMDDMDDFLSGTTEQY